MTSRLILPFWTQAGGERDQAEREEQGGGCPALGEPASILFVLGILKACPARIRCLSPSFGLALMINFSPSFGSSGNHCAAILLKVSPLFTTTSNVSENSTVLPSGFEFAGPGAEFPEPSAAAVP